MTNPDNVRGGFACPHCGHREFTREFLLQHIATTHPDQEQPS